MLGKLIKYDFRCLIRKFGPMWLGLAALALLNGFTVGHVLESDKFNGVLAFILGGVPIMLMVTMWIALLVMMVVFVCERFYKGLLGDEGYLMFTLPAATWEHIASKLIVALVLELITMLVGALSGILFSLVYDAKGFMGAIEEIRRSLQEIGFRLPAGSGWFIFGLVLLCIFSTVSSDLQIYQSIALGHLARKNRAAAAVLAYIAINVVMTILISVLVPMGRGFMNSIFLLLNDNSAEAFLQGGNRMLGLMLGWCVVKSILFFFGTNTILSRRLNLE